MVNWFNILLGIGRNIIDGSLGSFDKLLAAIDQDLTLN